MTRRLVVLTGLIGLSLGFTGCASAIVAHYDRTSLDGLPEKAFPLGWPRQQVEAKLGKPDASRPLPDGSRADTYTYTLRNPEWAKRKWGLAAGTLITVGFAEPFLLLLAAAEVAQNRRTATLRYDPDDFLLDHALPPVYGPPDEGLSSLSFDEIRARCRSEEPASETTPAARGAPPDQIGRAHV